MSRLGLWLLLAGGLAAGPSLAQSAAPAVDPNTRLAFPATLGGATLSRSGSAGAGTSYLYTAANGMEITIDIYGGRQRVPNGSSNPMILNQFNEDLQALAQQAPGLEKPSVSSACPYGQVTFRCSVFSAPGGSAGRLYGKMLLMGYREHFVKILIQWTQKSGQTAADADKVLNAFVPALMTGH